MESFDSRLFGLLPGVLTPTLCLSLLYKPLIPLLTISLAPPRPPPSKSWKEVRVSDLEAEPCIWSSACASTSLSTSRLELIEASEPLRDRVPRKGKNAVDGEGEGGSRSGAMLQHPVEVTHFNRVDTVHVPFRLHERVCVLPTGRFLRSPC